jgi:hypothetical protein
MGIISNTQKNNIEKREEITCGWSIGCLRRESLERKREWFCTE